MPVQLRVDAFPMCCSARIFCDFPNKQDQLFDNGRSNYNFRTGSYDREAPVTRSDYAAELAGWFTTTGRPTNIAAFDVITLSAPQIEYLGKDIMGVIEAAGFKKSPPSSGNHTHGVFMFTRINNPIDSEGSVKREHRGTVKYSPEAVKKLPGKKALVKKDIIPKKAVTRAARFFR